MDVVTELRLQGLELCKNLRFTVDLLQLRGGPGLHQQQRVRILGIKEIIVFQVAFLMNGVVSDTQLAQGLEKGVPLAGLAVIGDVPS